MSNERQGHVLEKQVAAWLKEVGATFVSQALVGKKVRADFLLVRPFPMVIEVLADPSPPALRMKTKRLMTQRLQVAQELGSHVPFVVFHGQSGEPVLPFADAVFSLSTLPSLEQLSTVRVNRQFLAFFDDAADRPIRLTDVDLFKPAWQHALTWEQLWSPSATFTSGTMASLISEKTAAIALDEARLAGRRPDPALTSPARMRHIASVADETLRTAIGGKRARVAVDLTFLGDRPVLFDAWRTTTIGTVVVSLKICSQLSLIQKIQEWSLDARLLLASGRVRRDGLVLVPIPRGDVPLDLRFLSAINELEAAGWRVFPSDFSESTPAFVQYLKDLA